MVFRLEAKVQFRGWSHDFQFFLQARQQQLFTWISWLKFRFDISSEEDLPQHLHYKTII